MIFRSTTGSIRQYLIGLMLLLSHASVTLAADAAALQGNFTGMLGGLHLQLHITAAPDGRLSATLDSADQGVSGIPGADVRIQDTALTFTVPSIQGSWRGTVEDNGDKLTGVWTQGAAMPLTFRRDAFVPAKIPSPIDGFWLGTLQGSPQSLRIQVFLKSDAAGKEFCTLDSLDQNAFNLPCDGVSSVGSDLSFEIPSVRGRWNGKLSPDHNSLIGTWSQQKSMPLIMTRQTVPQAPLPPPQVHYDQAKAPAGAAGMQGVLERDLQPTLKSGILSTSDSAGITVGVMRNGVRRVFAFGAARPDSIFEIGSISKTFTGLILAQMVAQGKVGLTDPVRELLPEGSVQKPAGREITLLDLTTQHSGLPRMPDNFKPGDAENPYRDYRAADLYQFLAARGVAVPADAAFLYSNLGVGLLGQALSNRAKLSYSQLLSEEVLTPLQMQDSSIAISADKRSRFILGHTAELAPAAPWDFDAFAGAGGIRSTADDMLIYLAANLHPDTLSDRVYAAASRTLPQAIRESHVLRNDAGNMRIAFGWFCDPATGTYWHNGATGGYSSYAFFNPKGDYAGVVLTNVAIGKKGSFADSVGKHMEERLDGRPAVALSEW